QILMHADGAHFLSAWSDEEGQGPVYMAPDAFFLQHGLPPQSLQMFRTMRQRFRTLTLPFQVTRTVRVAVSLRRRRCLVRTGGPFERGKLENDGPYQYLPDRGNSG